VVLVKGSWNRRLALGVTSALAASLLWTLVWMEDK
jgi:hypothetical protein